MEVYGGIQTTQQARAKSQPPSSPGFATPPPLDWHRFTTPTTYIQRKRGVDYINKRFIGGGDITPTVRRVKAKVDKFTELELHNEQLTSTHLTTVLAY